MKLLLLITILWTAWLAPNLQGQTRVSPEAVHVHRYEIGCGSSCQQEAAIDLGNGYARNPTDIVAIRFCSREPMARAISMAAAYPDGVLWQLTEIYNFTPDRILFLRSEDCLGSNPSVAATEYWVVPQGAVFPSFVERIKSCQVKFDDLEIEDTLHSSPRYRTELQNLPVRLRENPNLIGVVRGYYIGRPSRAMRQNMRNAQRFLERSGLSPDRYFAHLMHWTGEYGIDPPEPKPNYPTVFTIEILRECAAN